jgi:hypothetical protein
MANTGYTTLVNGVETDLIKIFEPLSGTKLTYNTNYVTSDGKDLTDIFQPYVEGDAVADPTKYTTLSGGVEKDLNVVFNAIPTVFPTLGASFPSQWAESASIYGKNTILGLYSGFGVYYSTNYGKSYTQSTGISGISTNVIVGVSLYGLRAIAHTSTLVFYSTNAGQTWQGASSPGPPSRNYQGCSLYENYAIITNFSNSLIFVSNNYGLTYSWLTMPASAIYKTPSISYDPVSLKYIAVCSTTNNGMWYCTNFKGDGTDVFSKSSTAINSNCVSLVGLKGICGAGGGDAGSGGGMYYTVNGGQTWTKSANAIGTISSTLNIGTFHCGLSANGVGIARGTDNVYYVTKNFGQTWANTSSTTYGVVAIHNGNAITNAQSNVYYGKISLI